MLLFKFLKLIFPVLSSSKSWKTLYTSSFESLLGIIGATIIQNSSKVSESLANIKSIIHQDSGIQDLTTKIYGEISKIISIKNEMINNRIL